MPATWNLIYFCFDILFSHSLMKHNEWGRGGSKVEGETDYYIVQSLWFPYWPVSLLCMLVGTCMFFFKKKLSLRLFHCVSISVTEAWRWIKQTSGLGSRRGVNSFSQSKGVSRDAVQFTSLVIMHNAPVKRPRPSVFLFTAALFFP